MRRIGLILLTLAVLAGCDFSIYSLPLPGGARIKGESYRATIEFADVLDLVPKSAVKVNDVTVGTVEKVWLEGFTAKVQVRMPKSVQLPDNARASIRQTSLLGEKFVSIGAPQGEESRGRLDDGELIPLSRTSSSVEVEEVFAALSLLLNGGGVAQLKTITQELNKALAGNEAAIKDVLKQLDTFVGTLDRNRKVIVDAITALDGLAKKLVAQKATLATAIDSLPASLKVLDRQRSALVRTLQALSKLGATGVRVINATQADLIANLKSLNPILTELVNAGTSLPTALELLFTYPFPDAAAKAVRGDYTNLEITLDVDTRKILQSIGLPTLPSLPVTIPTVTLSVPTALPTNLPTALPSRLPTGLPTLIPTKPPTLLPPRPPGSGPRPSTCVTLLGLPVCVPTLNRAQFDPALAELMMPGVTP